MGAAAAPVAWLESALAHGKTPTSSVADIDINSCPPHRHRCRLRAADDGRCGQRPPNGTGVRQAGQTSAPEATRTDERCPADTLTEERTYSPTGCMQTLLLLASPFASTLQISPPDTSRPHRPWSSDDVVRTVVHSLWTRVWSERMLRPNYGRRPYRTKPRSSPICSCFLHRSAHTELAAENQ